VVEPLGRDVLVTLKVGSATLKALTRPEETPKAGERVKLDLLGGKLHLFDTETGQALLKERHPARIDGDVRRLEADLKFFQEVGYDYVEVPADAIDVIFCGKLNRRRLRLLKEVLAQFKFRYTLHAPLALDLRARDDYELQLDLFSSSLELAAEIGAEVLVYHYGRKSHDPLLEERLLQGVIQMADYARELGVVICVENLDLGHGYLAATRFGFDFLEAVRIAAPLVGHLHLSDNFGHFEETRLTSYELYKQIPYRRRLALGKGDLHLPPGWGKVPWEEALGLLGDYQGVLILEYYHHRYILEAREILQMLRDKLQTINERRQGA